MSKSIIRWGLVGSAAALVACLGLATPVYAGDGLSLHDRSVGCSFSTPGPRLVTWIVVADVPGHLTGVSHTPASAVVSSTSAVGDMISSGHTAWLSLVVPAGPASATVTFNATLDASNGPRPVTFTDTVALPTCVPRPSASFDKNCNRVEVRITNGGNAGGYADYDVKADGGFESRSNGPVLQPDSTGLVDVPIAQSAHIAVSSGGAAVANLNWDPNSLCGYAGPGQGGGTTTTASHPPAPTTINPGAPARASANAQALPPSSVGPAATASLDGVAASGAGATSTRPAEAAPPTATRNVGVYVTAGSGITAALAAMAAILHVLRRRRGMPTPAVPDDPATHE